MAEATQDLSFKLLSLLSKERGIYGLRNGDHERYRKHCANKIHRLRLGTGLTSGKKGYKKPADITVSTVKDVKHLQLLLFSAERALAHSHELKAIHTRTPSRAIKKEQLSWLRRAHKLSSSLHSISSSLASDKRMDQRTFSEITIYHLSITSELSFEKGQWGETITSLAVRRRLLSTLSEAARDSYDQALALEFMDAYDPLIRFSAYKLGRSESHDIQGVVADVDTEMQEEALPGVEGLVTRLREELGSEKVEEGRRKLEDLKFADQGIELRNAEMVDVMTRAQAAMEGMQTKGKGMKGWDKVLGVLGEAEGLARKLVDDHEASGQSNPLRSAETSQSLSQTHQYTTHLLLTHRIRRDLLLADTLFSTKIIPDISSLSGIGEGTGLKVKGGKAKVEEAVKTLAGVVKLYDQILQSLGQIMGLGLVQEREEVRAGVEGLEAYYHAMRNFYLARLHTLHPSPSYSSAIRLLSRSSDLIRQAQSSLSGPILEPITTVTPTDISTLESNISILDLAAERALFAERVEKPLFFDNAFNYVDMPMDELLFRAGKGPRPEPATSVPAVTGVINKAEEVLSKVTPAVIGSGVPDRVKGLVRSTRELTPSASGAVSVRTWGEDEDMEDEEEMVEKGQQGKKGWLGGWFGRS